jgi:hypothetical protein
MNPNDLQLEDVFDSDFVDEFKVLYNYKIKIKIFKQKNGIIGTVPKSNRKNEERDKIDTINRQIHNRSHSWLGIRTLRS